VVRALSVAVVLVGAGDACRLWLPVVAAMPDADLLGLVDLDAERGRRLLREHGLDVPVRTDLRAAIAELRPAVVADLTPPANRRAVAGAAFAAGCDVVAEKPLAESVAGARALIDLAEAAGRRLVVMQNHRFHPAVERLRAWIRSGAAGRIGLLDCELHRAVAPFPRAEALPSPLLTDMAIHAFDQARNLTGCDAVRVHCREVRPPESGFAGAPVALCTFELEGGLVFTYRGSWAAAGHETPWFGRWRVDGTRAVARWEGDGAPVVERLLEHTAAGPRFERTLLEGSVEPNDHPAAVPALLRGLAGGVPVATEAADNIHSLAMVQAAIAAARDGGWAAVES
jgi:predicted dehydrogenase